MKSLSGIKQDETGRYYFDTAEGTQVYPDMPALKPYSYVLAHIWDWDGVGLSLPRPCLYGCGVCSSREVATVA